MQVQASSPTCKQTDPKAVVSGNFCRNNMAGPSKVGATWWLVDLGRQHRLICNYYLLRHDGSTDYPRDWVLQVEIQYLLCHVSHFFPIQCTCLSEAVLHDNWAATPGRLVRP